MHKSRLAGFIIDCQSDDLDGAAKFWSQALGYSRKPMEDDIYVPLETGPEGLHIEVQKVDHPSRVHLDIETDDIEAEVARLEALGASRVGKVKSWWVMAAPTGQLFCVVRVQGKGFEEKANQWE